MSDSNSDIESLKNIAKIPVEIKENTPTSEVHNFILSNNIKSGEAKIQAFLIYKLYADWKEKDLMRLARFFQDFSKFFPRKRTSQYTYYLLDPAPFNLSDEAYQEAKEFHQRQQQDKQRENQRQKQIKEENSKEKNGSK